MTVINLLRDHKTESRFDERKTLPSCNITK